MFEGLNRCCDRVDTAIESFSRFRIHGYLLVSLIPVFGILGRLAKFFVIEYNDFVGIKSEFRHLGE